MGEYSLYISVIFPVADFRSLHPEAAGRLSKPRWGESDPQAKFARGFGSIHFRTKSGIGFVGENYYADCDNLLKYPSLIFLDIAREYKRNILSYPINRRFYFDGQMAGRFEFSFRLNEPTLNDIQMLARTRGQTVTYDSLAAIAQISNKEVEVNNLDGREVRKRFIDISNDLRDAYLASSTKNAKINQYDIQNIGSAYVSVGSPFVFLRSGSQTPIVPPNGSRHLHSGDFRMFCARSGAQGSNIDSTVIESKYSLSGETERERLARLVYIQSRALSFAHSFYLRQVDSGLISGVSPLTPAISSMLERLQNLSPIEGNGYDREICSAMAEIVRNADIRPEQLAAEVEKRFKKGFIRRLLSPIFRTIDRKSDVAIEAAASTVTKFALTGGSF